MVNNKKNSQHFFKLNSPFSTVQLSYKLLRYVCSTLPVHTHQKFNLIPQRERVSREITVERIKFNPKFLKSKQQHYPTIWTVLVEFIRPAVRISHDCIISLSSTKLNPQERRFAICKVNIIMKREKNIEGKYCGFHNFAFVPCKNFIYRMHYGYLKHPHFNI